MRNAQQRERQRVRDGLIYQDFKRLSGRFLRSDYIFEQLSVKYFLSERTIREIVREQLSALAD